MIKCESSPPRLTILLHFDSSGGTHTHTHTLSQVCQVHPNSHVNGLENNIISCTNIHFHAPVKCKHGSALFNDNPNIPSGQFAAALLLLLLLLVSVITPLPIFPKSFKITTDEGPTTTLL